MFFHIPWQFLFLKLFLGPLHSNALISILVRTGVYFVLGLLGQSTCLSKSLPHLIAQNFVWVHEGLKRIDCVQGLSGRHVFQMLLKHSLRRKVVFALRWLFLQQGHLTAHSQICITKAVLLMLFHTWVRNTWCAHLMLLIDEVGERIAMRQGRIESFKCLKLQRTRLNHRVHRQVLHTLQMWKSALKLDWHQISWASIGVYLWKCDRWYWAIRLYRDRLDSLLGHCWCNNTLILNELLCVQFNCVLDWNWAFFFANSVFKHIQPGLIVALQVEEVVNFHLETSTFLRNALKSTRVFTAIHAHIEVADKTTPCVNVKVLRFWEVSASRGPNLTHQRMVYLNFLAESTCELEFTLRDNIHALKSLALLEDQAVFDVLVLLEEGANLQDDLLVLIGEARQRS